MVWLIRSFSYRSNIACGLHFSWGFYSSRRPCEIRWRRDERERPQHSAALQYNSTALLNNPSYYLSLMKEGLAWRRSVLVLYTISPYKYDLMYLKATNCLPITMAFLGNGGALLMRVLLCWLNFLLLLRVIHYDLLCFIFYYILSLFLFWCLLLYIYL